MRWGGSFGTLPFPHASLCSARSSGCTPVLCQPMLRLVHALLLHLRTFELSLLSHNDMRTQRESCQCSTCDYCASTFLASFALPLKGWLWCSLKSLLGRGQHGWDSKKRTSNEALGCIVDVVRRIVNTMPASVVLSGNDLCSKALSC